MNSLEVALGWGRFFLAGVFAFLFSVGGGFHKSVSYAHIYNTWSVVWLNYEREAYDLPLYVRVSWVLGV